MRGAASARSCSIAVEAETCNTDAVQMAVVMVVMQHVTELRSRISCGKQAHVHWRRRVTSLPTLLPPLKSPTYLQQRDESAAIAVHQQHKDVSQEKERPLA